MSEAVGAELNPDTPDETILLDIRWQGRGHGQSIRTDDGGRLDRFSRKRGMLADE